MVGVLISILEYYLEVGDELCEKSTHYEIIQKSSPNIYPIVG
jgi:hypothetical protein